MKSKKPLTWASKRVPGGPRKEELGEGLAEKVGEGLAKGWHRVGEELAKGWQRVGRFPCTLRFPETPVLEEQVCDSLGNVQETPAARKTRA